MLTEASVNPETAKNGRRRRLVATAVAAVFILLAGGTGAAWLFLRAASPSVDFAPMKFDAARWRASPAEFSWKSVRLRMVDDLLAKHPLAGMRRADIEAMLGPADQTAYFAGMDLVYRLGQERHPLGIDSEWLLIKCGADGRVEAASIGCD